MGKDGRYRLRRVEDPDFRLLKDEYEAHDDLARYTVIEEEFLTEWPRRIRRLVRVAGQIPVGIEGKQN